MSKKKNNSGLGNITRFAISTSIIMVLMFIADVIKVNPEKIYYFPIIVLLPFALAFVDIGRKNGFRNCRPVSFILIGIEWIVILLLLLSMTNVIHV